MTIKNDVNYSWKQIVNGCSLILYNVSVWSVRLCSHRWGIWLNHLFQPLFLPFRRPSSVTQRTPKLLNTASLLSLSLSPSWSSSSAFQPLGGCHFSCPPGLSHLYIHTLAFVLGMSSHPLFWWCGLLIFINATQVTSFSVTSLINLQPPLEGCFFLCAHIPCL